MGVGGASDCPADLTPVKAERGGRIGTQNHRAQHSVETVSARMMEIAKTKLPSEELPCWSGWTALGCSPLG